VAEGHGGYRQPTNPSPVSGPGALSRRTDGPLHGPVPASAPSADGTTLSPGPDLSQITPFGAPTERPNEPVTAGIAGGPGAGPVLPPPGQMTPEAAERLRSYLPVFILLASSPDADPATKQYVRQLRGELG
jgi:hypothetical protein